MTQREKKEQQKLQQERRLKKLYQLNIHYWYLQK